LPTKVLEGEIELPQKEIPEGEVELRYTVKIKNEGNVEVKDEEVKLELKGEDETIIAEKVYKITLEVGGKWEQEDAFVENLKEGEYTLRLTWGEKILDEERVKVVPTEKTASRSTELRPF